MEYKFHKEYFLDHDNDTVKVEWGGSHVFNVGFDSKFSHKLLKIFYRLGKPYVSLIGDEVEQVAPPKPKVKVKTKKKKVKIDEPKEEPTITNTESTEEES